MSFEVGDRVLGTEDHELEERRGDKGTVIKTRGKIVRVKWDSDGWNSLTFNNEITLLKDKSTGLCAFILKHERKAV